MTVYRWPDPTPVSALERYPVMGRADWNELPSGEIAIFTPEGEPGGLKGGGAAQSDDEAVAWAHKVVDRIKAIRQSFAGELGLYNLPWRYSSWSTVATVEKRRARYQARNDLLNAIIGPHLDFYVPELYAVEPDVRGAVNIQLNEAQRINGIKPVIPISWHRMWSGSAAIESPPLTWNQYRQIQLGIRAHRISRQCVYTAAGMVDETGHWIYQLEAAAEGWDL